MKKVALATFVIFTFIVYSIHERQQGSAIVVGNTTKPQSSGSSSTSTTSTSSSGTNSTPNSSPTSSPVSYKDGQYTGSSADAYYGYIQVQVTIQGGKLTDVQFLQYPNSEPNSIQVNTQAMPLLKQEAIAAQDANVDIVSGATDTSQAFIQSLTSALTKAQA